METKISFNHHKHTWINLNTNDRKELMQAYHQYNIDEEVIDYTLDKNERAHLDYDETANVFVLIYNVPKQEKIDNHYETIPMTFIVKENTLITVTNSRNHYLFLKMKMYLEKNTTITLFDFLFRSLFIITEQFFPLVEEMNADRVMVSTKLKERTNKQNLLALSDLEIGIVFFISASKQNVVLLEQIKIHRIYRELSENEKENLDDALIEAKQLVEMTQLSSQILSQLSSTYNNILNTNLNDTMRILTVLSVLLTIPTIITGFFGMNMPLPLEDNAAGWLITIVLSAILWFLLSHILKKLMK